MAVAFVSQAVNNASANTVTITVGTITDGQVLYGAFQTGGTGAAAISPPAGWTTLDTGTHGDGSRYGLFRIVASSLPTTADFVSSDATFINGAVYWYSGNDTSAPEDVTTTKATGAGPSNPTVPDITTVTDNALHVIINANRTSQFGGGAAPGGYTVRTGDGLAVRSCDKSITPAGLVTGLSITESKSNWVTWSIAIKPPAAAVNNAVFYLVA